jgi:TonB family protein
MSLRNLAWCALVLLPLGCGGAPTSAEPPSAGDAMARPESASAAPMAAPGGAGATDETRSSSVGAAAVSEPLTGGQLTQAQIRDVVEKNGELFDQCYLLGAGKSRDFVATVTVKATLGPSGTVTVAEVIKSTAKNKKVDTCVADAFKKIQFPAPKGAATSVITFPMEFQGTEEVRR